MNQAELISGFLEGLRPEPELTVSEWADKYRILSAKVAGEHGPWRTARVPYLREIMDCLSATNPIEEVVVMKGSQLGLTEAGCNWILYIIDYAPGPALMVMPTDETMRRNSKLRIAPALEDMPRLAMKVKPSRSRDSGNTILSKEFPGGTLDMTGANSATGLKSVPKRYIYLDEVDEYPPDLDGQGDPMDLARVRTNAFSRKKIYIISTPTVSGRSNIEKEFLTTDQRRYYVPCPHCHHTQVLVWENMKWEKGNPESVRYYCEECGAGIEERHKVAMLAKGEWRQTKPEKADPVRVGYHISALYSSFFGWPKIVKEWEKAEGDPTKEKVFQNTVLGESWKESGDSPPHEALYNRRESYPINRPPSSVCFITVGVDVQKDRLELEVVGWGRGKQSWSVDYRTILGDTAKPEPWAALARVVDESWSREDGVTIPMRMMAVDTGFNTQYALDFCRRYDPSRVVPIKGGHDTMQMMIGTPRAVDVSRAGKKIGQTRVWMVGGHIIKTELYGWLNMERGALPDGEFPPGWCHFPQYDQEHFRRLTAEKIEAVKDPKGFTKYVWKKKQGERNEQLDCRVYARAAAAILGIDRMRDEHFDALAGSSARVVGEKQAVKRKRSGGFWD